ncbi:MAG: hypothetical protein ACQETE_07100 [Bacteroidota bacterium]
MIEESKKYNRTSVNKPKVKKTKRYSLSLTRFVEKVRSVNLFFLLSAGVEIVAGVALVYLSMLGHIQPLWVATLMSMLGSIATMVGSYQWYELMRGANNVDGLVKDAIKRVINSQN